MEEITLQSIYQAIEELENAVQEVLELNKVTNAYSSKETKELDAALAKSQGDYPQIGYNKENPYFKSGYATLDHIMVRIRPILAKNGISMIQQRRYSQDGEMMLHTILKHSSGQWVESRSRVLPPKNDMQTLGSTLSYLKRYDAMALLGVTVSEDPSDDDAEVAMVDSRKAVVRGPSNTYNPKEQSPQAITKEQLEGLQYELTECPDLAEEVMDKLQIQSLSDLPKSKYQATLTRVREIKEMRAGRKK